MPPEFASQLVPAVKRLWNLYGPTETTIWSTGFRVSDPKEPVVIGRPIANTQCYILDALYQPVPIGVTGELYIAGDGLARGYLNRPELTAMKFVPDPFRGGEARMYRTGDLARHRTSEDIECLGRIDHQIKIRGYLVESGEIEAALCDQPEIEQAVVIAREDSSEDTRLVACVVARAGCAPNAPELKNRVRMRLPDYMVPSTIAFLDCFPRLAGGKIDRAFLPDRTQPHLVPEDAVSDHRGPLEGALAKIWADVLAVPAVGIHDDFFELGGTSLTAVRLFAKVVSLIPDFQPSLALLLKAPTVEQFARAIGGNARDWSLLVPLREGNKRPPFFCVHGAGGNVLSMRDLAMAMPPDQPFYCLQARGLDGHSPTFSTAEETAECYVGEIRKVQPRGPYFLGGGSYGGMVAFEMARRLESIGETVGLVALLDASNPAYERSLSTARVLYLNALFMTRRFFHHCKTLSSMKPQEWRRYSSARLKTFVRLAQVVMGRSDRRASIKVPPSQLEALGCQREFEGTLARVMEASRLAAQRFVPKPYKGHLHVFRAKVRHEDPYDNEALGWRSLALGGVIVFEIDGDHESIFRQPGVAAIAEALDKSIRCVQLDIRESAHLAQDVALV